MYSMGLNNIKQIEKIPLNLSVEEFLEKMIFSRNDTSEREECIKYLRLKGVAYHCLLANYIGLNDQGKIEYLKVSKLYKYDKRIINILYKYLSAFEEGLRAFFGNYFKDDLESFIASLTKRPTKILEKYKKIENPSKSLSFFLENLLFSELIYLVKKANAKLQKILFNRVMHLNKNLTALIKLRNAVSHHRLLFTYDDFIECYINGSVRTNNLRNNILNLAFLIDDRFYNNLRKEINESCVDRIDDEFSGNLIRKAIIKI